MRIKQVIVACCTFALVASMGVLSACSDNKDVAATWANGDVKEEQVTNYIENMRSMYGFSSDITGWQDFLKKRTYDTEESSNLNDVAASSSESSSESAEQAEGTVSDYRDYVIDQIVRNDVAEWEAGQRNLEVSDQEVEQRFEQEKQQVESQYMAGTFESILQRQGYKDVDTYREELKTQLQVDKLKEQIVGCTEDGENWDQSKWDSFLDALMAYADLKINPMPEGLSYDPATLGLDTVASSDSSAESSDAEAEASDVKVTDEGSEAANSDSASKSADK